MGKQKKSTHKNRLKGAFTLALMTGASAGALFMGHGIASADSSEGTVFGTPTSSVIQSSDPEWTNMVQSEQAALQKPFYQNARSNYMAQFNECSGLLTGPMIDCVSQKVNSGPNRIKVASGNIGFQSPAETIATGIGDSSSVVALEVDILENELDVPANQLLVTRIVDHDRPFTVLLAQAPDGGIPGPDSLVLTNIPAQRTQVSSIAANMRFVKGTTADPTATEAFKPYGLPKGPSVG